MGDFTLETRYIIAYFVNIISAVSFLWIGLYLLTRGGKSSVSVLTGMTCLIFSLYPFGNALGFFATSYYEYRFWEKATWWAAPLALAAWFSITSLILENAIKNQDFVQIRYVLKVLRGALILFAVIFILLGSFTNLIYIYDISEHSYVSDEKLYYRHDIIFGPIHPWYKSFLIFAVVLAVISSFFVFRLNNRENLIHVDNGLKWILGAAILLATGAIMNVFSRMWWLVFLGDVLILLGLLTFSASIIKYTTITNSKINRSDFFMSLVSISLILFIYLIVSVMLVMTRAEQLQKMPKLFFLTTEKTYFNWTQFSVGIMFLVILFMTYDHIRIYVIDYIVEEPNSDIRKRLFALIQASWHRTNKEIISDLQEIKNREDIREEIRRNVNRELLKSLNLSNSHALLAKSPLQKLISVQEILNERGVSASQASEIEKADALTTLLKKAFQSINNQLRRREKDTIGKVLNLCILKELPRQEILDEIGISSSSYDNYMNDGLELLSEEVFKIELSQKL